MEKQNEIHNGSNPRDHMAIERTFLAWVRTGVGIIAFGFVIEKFALFIKEMTFILGKGADQIALPPSHGYSAIVGIFLVGFGTLLSALAFVRFKKVENQIDKGRFQPSSWLDLLLTTVVVSVGVFLVIYLIQSSF